MVLHGSVMFGSLSEKHQYDAPGCLGLLFSVAFGKMQRGLDFQKESNYLLGEPTSGAASLKPHEVEIPTLATRTRARLFTLQRPEAVGW